MWIPATPRPFVGANGPDDVDGVAVPGVGVADDRHLHGITDASRVVDHLGHGPERDVGDTQVGVHRSGTGHVHSSESVRLDDAGGDRVVRAGRDEDLGSVHERSQGLSGAQRVSPLSS